MAQTASGYGISIICNMHYHISHSQSVIYSPFYSPFPLHFLPYSLPYSPHPSPCSSALCFLLPASSYPIHYLSLPSRALLLSFLTTSTLPCFSALSFPTTLPTILSPPSFAPLLPPFPLHFLPYLLPYSPHPPYLPILRIAIYLFIFVFFYVPFMSCMHIEHACVL